MFRTRAFGALAAVLLGQGTLRVEGPPGAEVERRVAGGPVWLSAGRVGPRGELLVGGLAPSVRYDVRVNGGAPVAGVAAGAGRVLHAWPGGLAAALARAASGDTVLVHAGVHRGSFALARDGVTLAAAGDGEAILEGDPAADLLRVSRARGVRVLGLRLRGARHAIWIGPDADDVLVEGVRASGARVAVRVGSAWGAAPSCTGVVVRGNAFDDPTRARAAGSAWRALKGTPDEAALVFVAAAGRAGAAPNVVERNLVGPGGFDGIAAERGTANLVVRDNTVVGALDDGISLDRGEGGTIVASGNLVRGALVGFSVAPARGGRIEIRGNTILDLAGHPGMHPAAFKIGGARSDVALLVEENLVNAPLADGIVDWGGPAGRNHRFRRNVLHVGRAALALTDPRSRIDADADDLDAPLLARLGARAIRTLDVLRAAGYERSGRVLVSASSPAR